MTLRCLGFIFIMSLSLVASAQTNLVPTIAGLEFELIGEYDTARLNHILAQELNEFMESSTLPTEFKGKLNRYHFYRHFLA